MLELLEQSEDNQFLVDVRIEVGRVVICGSASGNRILIIGMGSPVSSPIVKRAPIRKVETGERQRCRRSAIFFGF